MTSPRRTIYLDYNATTPCDPRVIEAMLPYFHDHPANPANTLHPEGRRAARAVEDARAQVAVLVGAQPEEIIFTSGGTESNNLAILGVARAHADGPRRKIVTTAVEHKAVLGPCEQLRSEGFEVVLLPVNVDGAVDLTAAAEQIDESTLLVSVQTANNEVGTIQPVAAVADLARAKGAFVHSDAAQAVGKIPVDVFHLGLELASLSAHKFCGPKGVGALFVRGGPQSSLLSPVLFGGGQETGTRPGTINVPGVVGTGCASEISRQMLDGETARLTALRDRFERYLSGKIQGLVVNGRMGERLPGTTNLSFSAVEGDVLSANVPLLAIGTGAACNSGALEPSPVLLAMGVERTAAKCSIRVSMGRFTSESDVQNAEEMLMQGYSRLVNTTG
jgi:cysteine desulfurase